MAWVKGKRHALAFGKRAQKESQQWKRASCAEARFNRAKTGSAATSGAGSRSFTGDVSATTCAPRARNGSRARSGKPAVAANHNGSNVRVWSGQKEKRSCL